jgi:hypothetical protein
MKRTPITRFWHPNVLYTVGGDTVGDPHVYVQIHLLDESIGGSEAVANASYPQERPRGAPGCFATGDLSRGYAMYLKDPSWSHVNVYVIQINVSDKFHRKDVNVYVRGNLKIGGIGYFHRAIFGGLIGIIHRFVQSSRLGFFQ